MYASDGLSDIERLVELQAIYRLKGRRDHAVDQKDWDTYADFARRLVDCRGFFWRKCRRRHPTECTKATAP